MSTKSLILSALQNSSDFISGEHLASSYNISRTAIWKAIRSLQNDGYKIEAVTNKGYKLVSEPDKLNSEQIKFFLDEKGIQNVKIFTFDEIDSTNSEAKRRAAEVGAFRTSSGDLTEKGGKTHLSLFAAETQTGGKGRLGRVFISPKNSGAYFSLLYSPKFGIKNPALYTAAAAVSVCRAVKKLYDEECEIKWVNDIFLAEKKISGILVEGILNFESGNIESAVVGIGINIRKLDLKKETTKIAGSIEEAKISRGKEFSPISKNILIAEVVKNLIEIYESFDNEDKNQEKNMIEEYRSRSMLIGKTVSVNPVAGTNAKTYQAKVLDITEEIKLIVESGDGTRKELNSGEVSLHSYDFL